MYHLIIAAWPEAAAVIMVGKETEEVDAKEVYRDYVFQPQLIQGIKKVLDIFSTDDISDCCVYGPEPYISKIAKDISLNFSTLSITTEKAGV